MEIWEQGTYAGFDSLGDASCIPAFLHSSSLEPNSIGLVVLAPGLSSGREGQSSRAGGARSSSHSPHSPHSPSPQTQSNLRLYWSVGWRAHHLPSLCCARLVRNPYRLQGKGKETQPAIARDRPLKGV